MEHSIMTCILLRSGGGGGGEYELFLGDMHGKLCINNKVEVRVCILRSLQ